MSSKSLETRAGQGPMTARPSSPQVFAGRMKGASGVNSSAGAISPRLVLAAITRWWKVALPVGVVLAAIGAAVVWKTFHRVYKASAWVQIYETQPVLLFGDQDNGRVVQSNVATQLQLITSPMVMYGMDGSIPTQGVVDQLLTGKIDGWRRSDVPDLPPDTARDRWYLNKWLVSKISVQQQGKQSALYTVSFSSVDPKFAKAITNAVVSEYLDLIKTQRADRNVDWIKLLNGIREERAPDKDAAQRKLEELVGNLPDGRLSLGPSGVESAPSPAMTIVRDRLTEAEVDLLLTKAQVEALKKATPEGDAEPTDRDLEGQILSDPNLRQQKEKILALESELESIKHTVRQAENYPRYLEKQETLQQLQKDLGADARAKFRQSSHATLAEAEARLKVRQLAVDSLKEQCEGLQVPTQPKNQDTWKLQQAKEEYEHEKDVLDRIDARILSLSFEQNAPLQGQSRMLAELPTRPEQDYPMKEWAMVLLLGLAAPFGAAVGWEALVRRISDSERLEKDLGLTVVGEIYRLPRRDRKHPAVFAAEGTRSLGLFHESLDALSTNVALSDNLRNAKVIAVTSAVAGEGKTSVAAQLAIRLSENADAKVLLIDGDMRSPDVHKLFDVPLEPGLVGVLEGKLTLDEAVVTGWSDRLDLLPAGRLASNPVSMLGNGHVRALLDEALAKYRFVVLDTPPVLPASEAVLLSNAADATLLCAMWDMSRSDQIQRANRRLLMSGIQTAGVVVNGVPARWYLRRYGSYSYPAAKG